MDNTSKNMLVSTVAIISLLFCGQIFANNVDRFDKILDQTVNSDAPGISVLVTEKGKTIYSAARGMANVELDVPLSVNSVFRLGSITKQFTCAAIMLLQERGKLSINDDIRKYIPDFPTEGHKITIKQLMSHTAGLANYTDNKTTMSKLIQAPTTLDEMLKLFAKEPMHSKPGEVMRYSNTGYVLLGKIIEVSSGGTYAEFLKHNIFDKNEMRDTQFGGLQLIKNRASGYTQTPEGLSNASLIDMSWPHAAGSLVSTVSDMAIWFKALSNGKIVSQKSYQQMVKPVLLNDKSESPYGFGLTNLKVRKHDAIAHGGGIPGFSTDAIYFPAEDIYIVALGNIDRSRARDIVQLFSAEMLGIKHKEFIPAKINQIDLEKALGTYKVNEKSIRTLSKENGVIYSQRDNGHKWEVIPMSNDSFYFKGTIDYFEIKEESGSIVMKMYSGLSELPQVSTKL